MHQLAAAVGEARVREHHLLRVQAADNRFLCSGPSCVCAVVLAVLISTLLPSLSLGLSHCHGCLLSPPLSVLLKLTAIVTASATNRVLVATEAHSLCVKEWKEQINPSEAVRPAKRVRAEVEQVGSSTAAEEKRPRMTLESLTDNVLVRALKFVCSEQPASGAPRQVHLVAAEWVVCDLQLID